MPQTQPIIQTLKQLLKSNGMTYATLAQQLQLSEASVKRMFMQGNFSLERLGQICDILGISFADLALKAQHHQNQIDALSYENEEIIAKDLLLLLVTVCVLNRWPYEEIKNYYNLTDAQCISKVSQLDKMGLIELLPNNQFRLLISSNFNWLNNGPIQKFFQQRIASDYFCPKFIDKEEKLIVLNGMLTEASNQQFIKKLTKLAQEFDNLNLEDSSKDFKERHGYTCILSLRAWKYGLFSHLTNTNKNH